MLSINGCTIFTKSKTANPKNKPDIALTLPLIFKGYMNQYLGLVLSFNNRIKLINLIVDKIYSITKEKESTTQ